MKCSITLRRDHNCGNIKSKMVNQLKSPYRKEQEFDDIVDQLYTQFQGKEEQKSTIQVGMHLHSPDQTEAVRKYYAAFPALKKGEESPLQYYLPPPAWCRKSSQDNQVMMQNELSISRDLNLIKTKKLSKGKERRNSYHGHRKSNKKRCHNYSRSFDSKENLPEWFTHEGVWDIEGQNPVKDFIRAMALDEGYGTCENTVTDDIREVVAVNSIMNEVRVPDREDSLNLDAEWVITEDLIQTHVRTPMEEELYAKFEAKFDRSLEALWSNDQANTPDDDYQDLPIDFQDLLSSPSDNQFARPSAEKSSMISLTDSVWSNDSFLGAVVNRPETPTRSVDVLHDRFKPLNLTDSVYVAQPRLPPPVQEVEPFSLFSSEGMYEAVPSVADVMRSLTAINHSKNHSSFTEVVPRRHSERNAARNVPRIVESKEAPAAEADRDDPLTSTRTHFRPIRKEARTVERTSVRYADGDTFVIRADFHRATYRKTESGYLHLESEVEEPKRYLEYRNGIDYGRLNLTEAQRRGNDMEDDEYRLKFVVKETEKGVQTESEGWAWGGCPECGRDAAKKMRPNGMESIWSAGECCKTRGRAAAPAPEELSRDWEELLSDIRAFFDAADRKRRHSACRPHARCSHPHAPFLLCLGSERPLTR